MSYPLETLIQKCTTVNSLRKARQLHALITTTITSANYAQSPYPNNNLIAMYAHCNSRFDAQLLFVKMPHRNSISYNSLITAYSKDPNFAKSSFRVFSDMGLQGFRPTGATFTSLLQVCCSLQDWEMGSLIHGQVVKCGFVNDVCVQTSLLGMYSNCGDMDSANEVFDNVEYKDDVLWNSMILGNVKNGRIKEGLCLFVAMVESGAIPNQFTWSIALNVCSKMGDYSSGRAIHARITALNVLADSAVENALLDMYHSCGDTETAFTVFSRMKNPSLVSWNSMISRCARNGEGEKAMDLFVKFLRMLLWKPDEYTYTGVISATAEFPAIGYGKCLHVHVIKSGFEQRVFVGTALLSMYFRNSDIESANRVFSSMKEKDVVLWTEIIMGHCRLGDAENALKLFCNMCREGHKSDSFAFSGILSACADLAALKQGQMVHSQAIKTGVDDEMSVCGSLIDMYAKNGNLQAAELIFSHVLKPDLKCWNSMMSGYSNHGMAEEAIMLFDDLLEHGLTPDQVTFLSMLTACNHSGLVQKGKSLWDHMNQSGIIPGPKHYSCMVSLLSRAGLLDEAENLIQTSACTQEHLKLWRTLLSSCINKRNFEGGVRAAEEVLRLDPEDNATNIMLSNLYAATGSWDNVVEMRRKMRELVSEKNPGVSWIEAMNDDVHIFSSDDHQNPVIDEARVEVHRLQGNMNSLVTDEYELEARMFSM
ncbi:Pentatricopeptide repeat (PPR) superfamily protein [Euphorbia peplus]|nr:Pentatricopeptide repeat (PPR) superfamily protein [Euphorbia peplus]